MAELKEEDLKKFIDAWTEPSQEEFDPEDFDQLGVELKAAWLDFEHAGRYSLKFRNQGFDVSGFGEFEWDEETDRRTCPFWRYVSSPDVNYYDAEFETQSRPAYDIALYREAFSNVDAFGDLSEALGDVFDAVRRRDAGKLASAARRYGFSLDAGGGISTDCFDKFGVIMSMRVFPAASV